MHHLSSSMDEQTLAERRDRTHAIVEGALLGDIAIVFLMMRVYLPLPVVRTLLRTLAAVPFVLLLQRRGLKITILATIASYILFSALVGPLLALTAVDVAVAGMLVGLGRSRGIPPAVNVLWTGVIYTILDVLFPTVASIFLFRFPVKTLISTARHAVKLVFQIARGGLHVVHAPASVIHSSHAWENWAVSHWLIVWLGVILVYGLLNMYLTVLVSEIVLNQLPEETQAKRRAAAGVAGVT
ncbi:MAG: YybS family protein [Chloroflexota bacterium]|nr:YybS family protein [Chloroflexota bacterium]